MRRATTASAASALLILGVLVPTAASADEVEDATRGVRVNVEISPLRCVIDCDPGISPQLPPTGSEFPVVLVWIACALFAAGVVLVAWRRIHTSPSRAGVASAIGPYYSVSGRRADSARTGHGSSAGGSASSQGDTPGRALEQGGSECPNR